MKYPHFSGVRTAYLCLLIAGLALSGGNAYTQNTTDEPRVFSAGHPQQLRDLPAGKFRSRLESLSPKARDRALKWLQKISFPREDVEYLRASKDGDIWYADTFQPGNANPETLNAPIVGEGIAASDIFKLHSRPGAPNVLFLDFDGATITGTGWNASEGVTTFQALPFDPSGNDSPATVANFTADELNRIGEIWHRISEDYSPF